MLEESAPEPHGGRSVLVLVTLVLGLGALVYSVGIPVLPVHAARSGLDIGDTGLLFAAFAAAQIVALLFALRFSSRFAPRSLLWVGFACFGLSAATFALSASWIPGLFAGRAFHGVGGSLVWIAGPALIARCYGPDTRGRALGTAMGVGALGSLAGPPVGGALYDWGGFAAPYVLGTGLTIVLAVCLAFAVRGPVGAVLRSIGPPGRSGVELGRLVRRPDVIGVLLVVGCASAALGLLEPLIPAVMYETMGTTGFENGLIFGVAVLFYGLTAPLAGWASDRLGRSPVMVVGLIVLAVAFACLPLGTTPLTMGVISCTVGVGLGLSLAPTMPALSVAVDAQSKGEADYTTAYALHSLVYAGGLFVGPSLGGQGVERFGLTATTATMCGVTALAAIGVWLLGRRRVG